MQFFIVINIFLQMLYEVTRRTGKCWGRSTCRPWDMPCGSAGSIGRDAVPAPVDSRVPLSNTERTDRRSHAVASAIVATTAACRETHRSEDWTGIAVQTAFLRGTLPPNQLRRRCTVLVQTALWWESTRRRLASTRRWLATRPRARIFATLLFQPARERLVSIGSAI